MLVLARKTGERVILRDCDGKLICEVSVTEIDGRVIRLGFEADMSVQIFRGEVDERLYPAAATIPLDTARTLE